MKCPGQDSRFWGAEAIFEGSCPNCGATVEFFKDEGSRKCRKCGHKVLNPRMDFGCAAYCRFASQCLGDDLPPELLAKRADLLKDRVAMEVKKLLGRDFKRIGRMLKVAEYAERIRKAEGGDPAIVTLAAYLSAASGGSGAGNARPAEEVLAGAGASPELSEGVLAIVNEIWEEFSAESRRVPDVSAGPRLDRSLNFGCVHDAVLIAELEEALKKQAPADEIAVRNTAQSLLTPSGKDVLEKMLEDRS